MGTTDVPMPESYTLDFLEDGTLAIGADCNRAVATYTTDGSKLSIMVGPMTMAMCPPESMSDRFVQLLGAATGYFFQDGELFIDTFADSGTLRFAAGAPVAEEAAPADAEAGPAEGLGSPEETLANMTYTGIFDDQPVTLVDGIAEIEEPGSGTPIVRLVASGTALGDLNGDGEQDAVALLEYNSSGSGRFVYIAPVLNVETAPVAGPATMIGDRIQVKSLEVVDGEVVSESIEQGEGDAACCPSTNMRRTFALQDGALVETGSEVLGKVSLADLDGTRWMLVDLAGGQEAPLPGTEITLRVVESKFGGSTGCNNYSAEVTPVEGAPQSFTVGPVATTRKLCVEPIMAQEATYTDRLSKALGWWFDGSKLMLNYDAGENLVSQLVYVGAE
jgi:heat shock protein HslJ